MPLQEHRRLLLIGWDAADWDLIRPLIDAGRMPHLARLIREGVSGNLASLRPCLTPMLWTTIATGVPADQHGILGFVEALPDHSGVVPSRSTSRKAPALWNMLAARKRRSCVITWPVSDPPEEIPGTYVSASVLDTLAQHPHEISTPPSDCFYPPDQAQSCDEWRFHPCELSPQDLATFIPKIAEIDLSKDPRPAKLARHFARAITTHSIATGLLERDEPWDLFAVYYETIDRVSHDFMEYRSPQLAGISDRDHELYREVVDAIYEFHDAMLGRLLELAPPNTIIALVSDHGFESGPQRTITHTAYQQGIVEEGAESHRMMGIITLHGPGIHQGKTIYGTTLYDVLPTLLACLNLPVGGDMPGKPIVQAFVEPPPIRKIPSWRQETTSTSTPSTPFLEQAASHFNAIRQFVALGYLPNDTLTPEKAVLTAIRESRFNLAIVHLQHARPAEALRILDQSIALQPPSPRDQQARLECLHALNRHQEALEQIAELESIGLTRISLHLSAASSLEAIGKKEEAAARVQLALAEYPDHLDGLVTAARMALLREDLNLAEQCAKRVLALDPSQSAAYGILASIALQQGDPQKAIDAATTSLQRYFFHPELHWIIAQAHHQQGNDQEALVACAQVLQQAPSHPQARQAWMTWQAPSTEP